VTRSAWDEAAIDLYARFLAGSVSSDDMVAELPPIWRSRERADPLGSDSAWRAMVDHAGYFTWASGQGGGRRARRPLLRKRLYRGAARDRRFGMSWTRSPAVADDFARNRQAPGIDDGRVWMGVFAPSRLLGYCADEREYLVDAVGADVRPWPPASPSRG
jgi:hypothetical protein